MRGRAGEAAPRRAAQNLRRSACVAVALAVVASAELAGAAECPRFRPFSDGLPTSREWRTHPALGDVNADGRLDVAGLPRKGPGPGVWLLEAAGRWRAASTGLAFPEPSCGVGVDLADVNGDGHLDLGAADHCHGLFVFLGDGAGSWRLGAAPPRATGGHEDLEFGDLDGDGRADLVAVGSSHGGISLFRGDGRGGWQPAEAGLPGGFGNDVALGDIDRDGQLDIAAAVVDDASGRDPKAATRKQPVVWLNGGAAKSFRSASDGLPDEGDFRGVALGDVDADGLLDLAISAGVWPGRPPLLVFRNDGARGWKPAASAHPESEPGTVFEGVALADLDRDAKLDLVAVSHRDAGIRVWRGDGRGGFAACRGTGLPSGRTELRGWGLAVADLNGDGKPDLAAGFGRGGAGALEVWTQR
jgi:hypothetical protein